MTAGMLKKLESIFILNAVYFINKESSHKHESERSVEWVFIGEIWLFLKQLQNISI